MVVLRVVGHPFIIVSGARSLLLTLPLFVTNSVATALVAYKAWSVFCLFRTTLLTGQHPGFTEDISSKFFLEQAPKKKSKASLFFLWSLARFIVSHGCGVSNICRVSSLKNVNLAILPSFRLQSFHICRQCLVYCHPSSHLSASCISSAPSRLTVRFSRAGHLPNCHRPLGRDREDKCEYHHDGAHEPLAEVCPGARRSARSRWRTNLVYYVHAERRS